jgi:NTE family protein
MNNLNRNWPLLHGLSDSEIQKVIDAATQRLFKSGEKLCLQHEIGESMFIILIGRARLSVQRNNETEQILDIIQPGDHFGELSLLTGSPRTATATALMDTTVLEIYKQDFYDLVHQVPQLSTNLSRTIGSWLQCELTRKVTRHKPRIIGLIRTSEKTAGFAKQIVQFFIRKRKVVDVFSDRITYWEFIEHKRLHETPNTQQGTNSTLLQLELTKAAEQCDHIIIDITGEKAIPELLMQCERVWWFLDQVKSRKDTSFIEQIHNFLKQQTELANRIQIVWTQPKLHRLAKIVHHHATTKHEDMRCAYDLKTKNLRLADLTRFYHSARGVHICLALGGGGAHGLAHLGVIAALEENGLFFDRVAGTSAGAIIAGGLGAGYDQQHLLKLISREMKPPNFMKFVPWSAKWYLMWLFRFGLVEQRFRKYLKDVTIEQLLTPVHMVSVDLIRGKEIIRSTGDVVSCILESINYPLFGKPIFRDGLALVDGGVLINVPSSVLRKQRADYIVAVDVSTKLSSNFGTNSHNTRAADMKSVGYFSTLNRVLNVSARELAKLHMSESDFLIAPDTSTYSFEDFTRGNELFEIGYNATQEVMPELKQSYENFIEKE